MSAYVDFIWTAYLKKQSKFRHLFQEENVLEVYNVRKIRSYSE